MQKNFSPLAWLAPLGAGGISIITFAFFNYSLTHPAGLINFSQTDGGLLVRILEGNMLLFIALHLLLTIFLIAPLVRFLRDENYQNFRDNPLQNSALLAPFISAAMTLNVLIGPIRYFVPAFYENLQMLMLPGFIAWVVLWILTMRFVVKLLAISFTKSFDIAKISFGWLLHPFTLGMVTVTGTGVAAMAADAVLANVAAFLSLISGSMGLFLLFVKTISIFKSHFAADGLPAKQFLPSFLIVIPNITLYAISAFRLGHWLEKFHAAELGNYFKIVMTTAFAFETWYLFFGFVLLADYFRRHFFREYHVSQWGLVCPLVAYAVLGSFVYKVFAPILLTKIVILTTTAVVVLLFFFLLKKMFCCRKSCGNFSCE
ncbi:hypothetical protein K9N08_00080 [Candidatus Gracilibacteria bacterium]|nr:hypothetical protein [Candidatus Gracilibacteria bacterium]MCF7896359.1 hypothetical protein [Candidatus Gracilibacteria bacterium]